jgi:Leucine-rich repeat (LRR) protein
MHRRLISFIPKPFSIVLLFCIVLPIYVLVFDRELPWIVAAKIGQESVLDLRTADITQLPPEIGILTHLTKLYLDSCEIKWIAPEIGNLLNLTVLSLSGNQLTELPPEIGNLTHLEYLNLSSNYLTKLPPEIANLTNLKGIYLNNNPFDAPQAVIEQGDWAIFKYYAK